MCFMIKKPLFTVEVFCIALIQLQWLSFSSRTWSDDSVPKFIRYSYVEFLEKNYNQGGTESSDQEKTRQISGQTEEYWPRKKIK